MSMPEEDTRTAGREDAAAVGWGGAIVRAAVVLIVSFVGFVYVPNLLVTHVLEQTASRSRDALVLLWVAAFFVFDCRLVVRLQRRRHGAVHV
jgi:uncharacterized protein YacL